MFVFLVVALIALLVYSVLIFKPKNFPPGPPVLPFVGSLPFIPTKNAHFTMSEKWLKEYGPVVGLMFGNRPAIAVCAAKEVLEVLKREEFQGRPDNFNSRYRAFNRRLGFFSTDGPFWVEQRRFTLRHLRDLGFGKKSLEGIIIEEAEELIEQLKSDEIQDVEFFSLSAVNVLWAVMGGIRYSRNDSRFITVLKMIAQLFKSGNPSGDILDVIPSLRFINPNIAGFKVRKIGTFNAQNFLRDTIREHIKTIDENEPRDFIDVYLKEMKHNSGSTNLTFSEDALIMILLDLFAAGAESVAHTLDFALLYMVLNPHTQKKVQEELDTVVGHGRRPSLDDKPNLPYVEAVIAETLRINPIAPQTPQHRATRDTTLNGYDIPKDTSVLVNLWCVLSDPGHWGDPENFRPERFLNAEGKFVKDDWSINFGLGKRICLGESLARNVLFIFFTTFLQEFSFSLVEGDPKPSTYPRPGFTVAPQKFRMRMKQRV